MATRVWLHGYAIDSILLAFFLSHLDLRRMSADMEISNANETMLTYILPSFSRFGTPLAWPRYVHRLFIASPGPLPTSSDDPPSFSVGPIDRAGFRLPFPRGACSRGRATPLRLRLPFSERPPETRQAIEEFTWERSRVTLAGTWVVPPRRTAPLLHLVERRIDPITRTVLTLQKIAASDPLPQQSSPPHLASMRPDMSTAGRRGSGTANPHSRRVGRRCRFRGSGRRDEACCRRASAVQRNLPPAGATFAAQVGRRGTRSNAEIRATSTRQAVITSSSTLRRPG